MRWEPCGFSVFRLTSQKHPLSSSRRICYISTECPCCPGATLTFRGEEEPFWLQDWILAALEGSRSSDWGETGQEGTALSGTLNDWRAAWRIVWVCSFINLIFDALRHDMICPKAVFKIVYLNKLCNLSPVWFKLVIILTCEVHEAASCAEIVMLLLPSAGNTWTFHEWTGSLQL